ncbi:putative deoxyribonuclease TATDN2 [Caerostris darwini]|uniref:Deoxyribonuclease TATDN2 n=1 Tax=Caerostris darwini TaxID=1538125 RepID=A0AAV4TEW4_9ARAC|nr:putative deoxyribonuclease TATDN2 [Caerostris darwini]
MHFGNYEGGILVVRWKRANASAHSRCISIRPPVAKHFHLLFAAQNHGAFAGKVVDDCRGIVARGPECQWKVQLVGFCPVLRYDIRSHITRDSNMTRNPCKCRAQPLVSSAAHYANYVRSRSKNLKPRIPISKRPSNTDANLPKNSKKNLYHTETCTSELSKTNTKDNKCESCELLGERLKHQEKLEKQRHRKNKNHLPNYNFLVLLTMKSKSGFIDSHCHLDFLFAREKFSGTYSDYKLKHKRTYPDSYQGCVAVFCKPLTFSKRSDWEKHLKEENIWAAFGCHPHNAADYNDNSEKALKIALFHPKVRALGEIGLDYSNRNNCLRETQHQVFKRQLKIAFDKRLPVVIHCRDANGDCIRILQEFLPKDYTFHLHCFTDNWKWAQKWMKAFPNVFIGITNLVTYRSAETTHEVARNIPLNHLLLETDAPYFVPRKVSKNFRWSHPGMAIHVAAQIAELKNIALEEVLYWTHKNTREMNYFFQKLHKKFESGCHLNNLQTYEGDIAISK